MSQLPLTFGIQTLDDLICPGAKRETDESSAHAWTCAIQGPDGCGKSILALHLASSYWLNNANDPPDVIYVSTDLSHDQAEMQWYAFGLDQPRKRNEALDNWYGLKSARDTPIGPLRDPDLSLELLDPVADKKNVTDGKTIAGFFDRKPGVKSPVWFVDLQSATAGDDWGWINQFIGLVTDRKDTQAKHLLIIDAVEGLEMMVGDRDAYGNRRSRRSRIAQLIRNATRKGMHVVFVVEESRKNERLPEQFVTDLVVRVRQHVSGDYSQRTIEIEKCRAIAHVRGEHELSIRTGAGVFTGTQAHLDLPRIPWIDQDENGGKLEDSKVTYLAHVHITRSLHRRNRELREDRVKIPQSTGRPFLDLNELEYGFGGLLNAEATNGSPLQSGGRKQSDSSLTLVLGEAGTHKAKIGRAFLAGAIGFDTDGTPLSIEELGSGIAILITTRLIDRHALIQLMLSHWPQPAKDHYFEKEKQRLDDSVALERFRSNYLRNQVFCQRLGSRRLASAPLGEIIATYVAHAQQLLLKKKTIQQVLDAVEERRTVGSRIRIVIEDWNALLASHLELRQDSELFSSMIAMLRREQLNALIISTQPARPNIPLQLNSEPPDLRSIDEPQIWTWPVTFYGERRTAITVGSGTHSSDGLAIFELLPRDLTRMDDDALRVDPHFDIYRDVETGKPTRVPLVVRLYAGSHPPDPSPHRPRVTKLMQDALSQVFSSPDISHDVVQFDSYERYDRFFAFALELNTARLDHSLILQIDEFWSTEHKSFADLASFWTREKVVHQGTGVYQPTLSSREAYFCHSDKNVAQLTKDVERANPEFFDDAANRALSREVFLQAAKAASVDKTPIDIPVPPITAAGKRTPAYGAGEQSRSQFFIDWWRERTGVATAGEKEIDRIPFLWDFGMLLADRELWVRYRKAEIPGRFVADKVFPWTVGDVWDALCLRRSRIEPNPLDWRNLQTRCRRELDWGIFFDACRLIASEERIPAFDIDLSTGETLTCLVLEIWASFQDQISQICNGRLWRSAERSSLKQLVQNFPHSLFLTLAHLIRTCSHLCSKHRVVTRRHESPRAVASREWYHTASARLMNREPGTSTLLALPGRWTARGDWALAVVKGSRSKRLAYQAIDLLTSRRMNLLRLQDGLGLPVRDVLPDSQIGELPTAILAEDTETDVTSAIDYKEICFLGAAEHFQFSWLWRSRIAHFDRDSFYFRRWIARLFEERDWLPDDLASQTCKSVSNAEEVAAKLAPGETAPLHNEKFRDAMTEKYRDKFCSKLEIIAAALRAS